MPSFPQDGEAEWSIFRIEEDRDRPHEPMTSVAVVLQDAVTGRRRVYHFETIGWPKYIDGKPLVSRILRGHQAAAVRVFEGRGLNTYRILLDTKTGTIRVKGPKGFIRAWASRMASLTWSCA